MAKPVAEDIATPTKNASRQALNPLSMTPDTSFCGLPRMFSQWRSSWYNEKCSKAVSLELHIRPSLVEAIVSLSMGDHQIFGEDTCPATGSSANVVSAQPLQTRYSIDVSANPPGSAPAVWRQLLFGRGHSPTYREGISPRKPWERPGPKTRLEPSKAKLSGVHL